MGGKAFEGVTRRIKQSEIPATLSWLEKMWPDHKLNTVQELGHALLGSTGKVESSGDIDLNLDINAYDQEIVAQQLVAILGEEYVKARPGNNQIFTAVPIEGDVEKGRIQVDFMFGDFTWQRFSYFSPARTDSIRWGNQIASYFKGLYRTEYLKAITAYSSDWVLEDNGEMIARVGPTFFHDRGLVWRYRHRPMRKDGTARVKALEELSKDEFLQLYPSALPAITDTIKDPEQAAKFLLGDYASVNTCNTLENIFLYTRRHHSNEAIKMINKIFVERLNSLKVEIPEKDFREIYLKV